MTSYVQARDSVLALLPSMAGWTVYTDGVASGGSPPWIVVAFDESSRDGSESLHTMVHYGMLDIRVVGVSANSVNIACDKLATALDGMHPADSTVGALVPDRDSGVYASELVNTKTGIPFVMRVLTWRTGWSA